MIVIMSEKFSFLESADNQLSALFVINYLTSSDDHTMNGFLSEVGYATRGYNLYIRPVAKQRFTTESQIP